MYENPSPLRIADLRANAHHFHTSIVPFRLLTVSMVFTLRKWLSLPLFMYTVEPLTMSRKPSLFRSPMGPLPKLDRHRSEGQVAVVPHERAAAEDVQPTIVVEVVRGELMLDPVYVSKPGPGVILTNDPRSLRISL